MPLRIKIALTGSTFAVVMLFTILVRYSQDHYPQERFAGLTAEVINHGKAVYLSGHVMGSIYCVGRVSMRLHGSEANVRMHPRLFCPRQSSGDFELVISVPQGGVERVTYGRDRTVISRPGSVGAPRS